MYAGRKRYNVVQVGHGGCVGLEGIWRHGYAVCRKIERCQVLKCESTRNWREGNLSVIYIYIYIYTNK